MFIVIQFYLWTLSFWKDNLGLSFFHPVALLCSWRPQRFYWILCLWLAVKRKTGESSWDLLQKATEAQTQNSLACRTLSILNCSELNTYFRKHHLSLCQEKWTGREHLALPQVKMSSLVKVFYFNWLNAHLLMKKKVKWKWYYFCKPIIVLPSS